MSDVTLSQDQVDGLKAMVEWYKSPNKAKKPFFLGGFGGCGKTFLTKFFLKEVGLGEHTKTSPGAVTAAYTGMAAKVMRASGVKNATTIHRMIYRLVEPSEEEFERLESDIKQAAKKAAKMKEGDERNGLFAHIVGLQKKMQRFNKPMFVLDLFGLAATAKLFVLDEVSMVGDSIGADVMKFGVPVLVIGDPGQLPPPDNTSGFFTNREPDFMLTEIHRQAKDNPIIRMAALAREGEPIPFGKFGDGVEKREMSKLTIQRLLNYDLVLCGKNETRFRIGRELRKAKGITTELPTGKEGELVVCKRNNNELGIVNGERINLSNVKKETPFSISADIKSAEAVNGEATKSYRRSIYTGDFKQHVDFDKDRKRKEWKETRDRVWADWADVTTVHGAQGTERESVAIIDDGFRVWRDDEHKMRYTAISRAKQRLIIFS